MSIRLNGDPYDVAAPLSVHDLLGVAGVPRADVAVALDGAVVPRSQWETTQVGDGADVEIVTAVQGG